MRAFEVVELDVVSYFCPQFVHIISRSYLGANPVFRRAAQVSARQSQFADALVEHVRELMVFQSPFWRDDHFRRALAYKTLQHDVAPQPRYVFYHDVRIFACRENREGVFGKFFGQRRALDDLQLVELEDIYGQFGDERSLSQHFALVLARQSEYDVGACQDAQAVRLDNGLAATFERVAPVYSPQGGVVGRLDTVFHQDKRLPVELLQVGERLVGYAVGTGAYDESHHAVYRQRFLVFGLQLG